MKRSGLLLSGGMDSISLAYMKRPDIAFTLDYGQKPAKSEIYASKVVCEHLKIEHRIIHVNCSELGSGDLSDSDHLELAPSSEWWPYRNQLLITLTLMEAIKHGVGELFVGSVRTDGFHADGRPEFFELINDLSKYQEGGIKVSAPAIEFSTVELIQKAKIPMELLLWSHSCHTNNIPCHKCNGCKKYLSTLQALGVEKK